MLINGAINILPPKGHILYYMEDMLKHEYQSDNKPPSFDPRHIQFHPSSVYSTVLFGHHPSKE